jgi:hypothetical protein
MDLHALAVKDSHDIMNNTLGAGGFSVDHVFTDLSDNELTIKAWYDDTSIQINPENGQLMTGSKITVKFHQSDLIIWDGLSDLQRWKISFTNGAGQLINCEIENVAPDRSFGDVLVFCKIISGHD